MIGKINRFFIFCLLLASIPVAAQEKDKPAVTYEELYDEPYSVNKLFIGFQPLYGELFATNVNAGFGLEASYYLKDKMDFKAHFRKTYSSSFFDFNRQAALDNSDVIAKPNSFTYFELGGTYHIKDFDESGKTKMVLYKKSFKGNRWASTVPLHAEVPCKVRKIYGVRLGGIMWNSAVDLNRALKAQDLTNADITKANGDGLPLTLTDLNTGKVKDFSVFSNINATNVYLGGSLSWFRNVAVSFDKYEEGIDDGMLTVFFDVMFAPALSVDPVGYRDPNTLLVDEYSTSAIKTTSFGFRAGIDGKFNRTLSWAYGGEIGVRPSITGQGLYVMFKISFPVFGTNLDYKVESFGK
ncbi:MAG: hypothetical protein HOP30_18680 [Cyclobacteriaceae bacterium]|nr:hypothetical protein [Cyclobacteriaceae bacterium]